MKNKFMTRPAQAKPKVEAYEAPKEQHNPATPLTTQQTQPQVPNTTTHSQNTFLQKKNFYFSESNNTIAFSIDSKPSGHNIFHKPQLKAKSEARCRLELGFLEHAKKL